MSYDLTNLNDYEFELLIRDILEKKLGIELRTYAKGKDDGIDIQAYYTENNIIVQVKHYCRSTYSSLLNSLKKELDKINKLKPEKYYIVTSLALTPNNIKNIYNMFSSYMSDTSNIIDLSEINKLLEENTDIVERHYKLWLSSSYILQIINNQNILIDCEYLIDDIKKEKHLYVQTSFYKKSIDILDKNHVIIITGDPGVGKTTLSKMLVLFYLEKNYNVRYSSDSSIKDIKKSIFKGKNKEVILIDDFLGQHYLELRENYAKELKTLISHSKMCNKKLILNTRITIMNEAKNSFIEFDKIIKENDTVLIDLNEISNYERALILYNHMYFSDIPKSYFNNIKKNKNYYRIINHNNYNPRIIEYITSNYKDVKSDEYINFIIDNLNNPAKIWENEFVKRIEKVDRIMMYTIYSLTNHYIDINILKESFNKRLFELKNMDTTINNFDSTLNRLSNSLVKINIDSNNNKNISVLNPSINDYIFNYLRDNENEIMNILNNAVYIEQYVNLYKKTDECFIKEKIVNLIYDGSICNLKSYTNIYYEVLSLILEFNIKDLNIISIVKDCFIKSSDNIKINTYSSFIIKLCDSTLWDFYNLNDIFLEVNNFNKISKNINCRFMIDVLYKIKNKYGLSYNDDFIKNLKKIFDKNIYEFLDNFFLEEMCEFAEEVVSDVINDYIDQNDLEELDDNFDIDSIYQDISPVIDQLSYIIKKINTIFDYCDENYLISSIENSYDIWEFFENALQNNDYYKSSDKRYGDDYIPNDDINQIDIIFNRNFK
ncbi:restriction endonuclease [Brachyspira pilosicoli]|uniref:nSTAND3 domain-containing NTPase n=1 Tax=Brachyspira pilosicoli TaxID=52584 RepID=UPI003005EBE9